MSGRCPKCGRDWPINAPCSRCTQSGAALPAEHAPPDPDLEHHALMARVRDALHAAYQCGTERNRPGFQQIDGALHRFLLGVRGARGAAPERAPLLPDTFVERAVSIAQAMPNPNADVTVMLSAFEAVVATRRVQEAELRLKRAREAWVGGRPLGGVGGP